MEKKTLQSTKSLFSRWQKMEQMLKSINMHYTIKSLYYFFLNIRTCGRFEVSLDIVSLSVSWWIIPEGKRRYKRLAEVSPSFFWGGVKRRQELDAQRHDSFVTLEGSLPLPGFQVPHTPLSQIISSFPLSTNKRNIILLLQGRHKAEPKDENGNEGRSSLKQQIVKLYASWPIFLLTFKKKNYVKIPYSNEKE